jgi:predicted 3-demethylubiquinone-9 3-methyltransferase (glyoxalase superfamily)
MQFAKITNCLWFDYQAEEAVQFYCSIFKNSKIGKTTRFGSEGFEHHGKPEGSVMTVEFELNGQSFVALNGGNYFKFNEAISFIINCDSQEEIDHYWDNLSRGGDPNAQQCGWLKDKYGLSWQVVPTKLQEWLTDKDNEKIKRLNTAIFKTIKVNIQELQDAFDGISKV